MNTRLLKVAKYLGKQGLYEEAASLKVLAMSPEDRFAITEGLAEGGDRDEGDSPTGNLTITDEASIIDNFFTKFEELEGVEKLDHYHQLTSFLNEFLKSEKVMGYMNVNDIKWEELENKIMKDPRWAEIVKKLD